LLHKPTDKLVAEALTKPLSRVYFLGKRVQMNLERKNEEQPMKKALIGRVVTRRRFKPSVFSLTLMFLNLLSLRLTNGQKFDEGSSVVWQKLGEPSIVGFNCVNLKIRLVSICTLLPLEGLSTNDSLKM